MAAIQSTFLSLPTLPFPPARSLRRKLVAAKVVVVAAASTSSPGTNGGEYRRGKLVDENMIVLRMRIQEMKVQQQESSDELLPSDWMEWEKRYYPHYNGDVCEAVGLLQSFLMNTRPCLGVGFLGLIVLCLPISTALLILRAIEMVQGILSGVHLS